ncbi:MAG: response regulator [Planctomycetota bacterium]|jgi:CheY-like chemotaxis protein
MREDIIILIAEDEQSHFLLTKRCLLDAGLGNEIIWLKDGQEAFDFFYSTGNGASYDKSRKYVLLLDIRMPRIDGMKVLEKIKQDKDLNEIPVVVVTTSKDPRQAEECYNLGCDAHVVKPVNKMLAKTIKRVTNRI